MGYLGAAGLRVTLPLGTRGLPPSALPGISPSRGEIDLWLGLAHLEA
ncbi:hypothetical protein N434_04216 [Rhizobium sp. UGM030330-04]|nr:hypothetical protein N434_04216 [Rhizobium sp. UGM030330-04]